MKSSIGLSEQDKKNIKKFMKDKIANSNLIIDYLKGLESDNSKELKKSLTLLSKIFFSLINDKDIKLPKKLPENVLSAKDKYDKWLYDRYDEVHNQLLQLLQHSDNQIQLLSLNVILKLLQKESNNPITAEKLSTLRFPLNRLKALVTILISQLKNNVVLIKKFRENLEFPDFLFVTLHSVATMLKEQKKVEKQNKIFLYNIFSLMEMASLPVPGTKPLRNPPLFITLNNKATVDDDEEPVFTVPYNEAQDHFDAIWEVILHLEFPPDLYKRALVLIPEKVLIHLKTPVILTDFFLNAYNLGGAFSLMALHGVFILVNQYNLEYPDFYNKLYTMLEPTIFQAKFKSRFFVLCDKFFSSPLLPQYIVASFIKKLCRLMLVAPSSSLKLLLKFVVNLLLRYPTLQFLIDNHSVTSLDSDPFVDTEPVPKLSRATESSLWEVKTLRQHPLCGVAKAANFIDSKNLPDFEFDISKFSDFSNDQLYEKASKVRQPVVSTTFYKPVSLFKYSDDKMSSDWSIL